MSQAVPADRRWCESDQGLERDDLLPAMHGLLQLGPSGPFRHGSHPKWFFAEQRVVRILALDDYRSALVEDGVDASRVARDLTGWMSEIGSTSTP
jgi:hypothetical protein